MRYFIKFSVSLTILVCFISCAEKKIHPYQAIVSSDIDNFFNAFDAIHQTTDSLEQLISLRTEFLDKASEGRVSNSGDETILEGGSCPMDAIDVQPGLWLGGEA